MREEKQQFNVYLTPDTVKRMKHRSVDEQLSMSDLVEKVFLAYLSKTSEEDVPVENTQQAQGEAMVRLQPMLHVDDMGKALDFYSKLGATVLNSSRDGVWWYRLSRQFETKNKIKLSSSRNRFYALK